MLLTLFNVIYVLVAIGMSVLILLQRGAGAQAGSGFGGGASGTVFGARGASTFLSRSTGVLAGLFFLLSLAMGVYLGHSGTQRPADDLGVMSNVEAPAPKAPEAPAGGDVPKASDLAAVPASDIPATPAADKPAVPASDTPAAPAGEKPAVSAEKPAAPAAPAASKPAPKAKATGKAQPKPAEPEKH
jgi:preprotein translocase subunit SecG